MAISAQGTQILRNGVAILEVGDVFPPVLSREARDASVWLGDDEDVLVGRRHVGLLLFDLNWVESEHSDLLTAWSNGTFDAYEVAFPDGTTWYFSGAIEDIAPKAPVEGKLGVRVTIVVTGALTFAAPVVDLLLLETGDGLLLENGNSIAL